MGAVGGGLFHACKQLVWGPQNYKFRSAFEVCAHCSGAHVHRASELIAGSAIAWSTLIDMFIFFCHVHISLRACQACRNVRGRPAVDHSARARHDRLSWSIRAPLPSTALV